MMVCKQIWCNSTERTLYVDRPVLLKFVSTQVSVTVSALWTADVQFKELLDFISAGNFRTTRDTSSEKTMVSWYTVYIYRETVQYITICVAAEENKP